MNPPDFSHESDPVFRRASEVYGAAFALTRTSSRWLNGALRRHSLRILEHASAAGDAPSVALRGQSLRYAKLSTLKLCAVIEALREERQLTDEMHVHTRRLLALLLSEINVALEQRQPAKKSATLPPESAGEGPEREEQTPLPDERPTVEHDPRSVGASESQLAHLAHAGTS